MSNGLGSSIDRHSDQRQYGRYPRSRTGTCRGGGQRNRHDRVGTVTSSIGDARRELSAAKLAHFACHARPRLDSPMFSSLVLDDGELTLYDIERLGGAPDLVIVAACGGGSVLLATGDEVLGLASAFLSLGAGTVVAPPFTVSDEATATVMRSVHRSLAAACDPATALLEARNNDDALVAFTAGSFTCFGGGSRNLYHAPNLDLS